MSISRPLPVIVTLILLGRWLEARARGRAGTAIAGLIALRPDTAPRLDPDGSPSDVPLAEIVPGDRLLLRPGARVAVDGVVEDGRSHVDEAMLTGEPLPVGKTPGDAVTAGTVNGSGSLVYPRDRRWLRHGSRAHRGHGRGCAIRPPSRAIADRPRDGRSSCPVGAG